MMHYLIFVLFDSRFSSLCFKCALKQYLLQQYFKIDLVPHFLLGFELAYQSGHQKFKYFHNKNLQFFFQALQ